MSPPRPAFHLPGNSIIDITAGRPITYVVPVASDIALALERYAGEQHKRPETIIAELVRAGLGVDA